MRIGSLCAGIGGFDLAARAVGWTTAWVSEIDPFCAAVLAHHFPEAPNLGDIRTIDWATVPRVDVLCGGFPCQPASAAGKRQGTADARWLWPECARALRGLRPRWAVFENVRGLLSVNGGEAFAEVLGDLDALGYDVAWEVVSAARVGAPHRRDRVWIVAHAPGVRLSGSGLGTQPSDLAAVPYREASHVVDAVRRDAVPFLCRRHDGVPTRLAHAGLHSLGNAIVPQCAALIFQAIQAIDNEAVTY